MIKGKAVLIIERVASYKSNARDAFQFEVQAHIITPSGKGGDWNAHDEAYQMFMELLTYDTLPAPSAAYKLGIGDRVTVAVSYEFHFTRGDGWTIDDDVDLCYTKERVLKRRAFKPRSERYSCFSRME